MAGNSESNKQELYAERRRVDLLRQQVFYPRDDQPDEALLEELKTAERKLAELERMAPVNEDKSLLIDSREGEKPDGGQLMGAATTGLEVLVNLRQAQVPTGIVHLFEKETHPLVSYELKYTGREFMRVQLSCWVEGYSAEAVDAVELTYQQRTAEVKQLPTFFPQQIKAVTELTRATMHIKVEDLDGEVELHRTYPLWLLARTSAYLTMRDPATGKTVDLRPYLAAWVTPNAPKVKELLRRAVELHPERRIISYQANAAGVREQVRSIYNALKAEKLTYINSLVSFGAASGSQMQRVRLPREALKFRSANCLDGSVLMASVLEFASLNPGIVFIPGHAFLAWQPYQAAGEETADWDYLETTMIADAEFEAANERGQFLAQQYQQLRDEMNNDYQFYLLSLTKARTLHRIHPME